MNKVGKARRVRVFARDNYHCTCCGSVGDLTIDHIIPRAHGGTNDIKNLQTLCQQCNVNKGSDVVTYVSYRKTISYLRSKGYVLRPFMLATFCVIP